MEDLLRVGVISNTHGLRGEVKVFPTTDDPARFKDLKEIFLDTKPKKMVLEIQSVKFFKKLVILKFKGIDDINDIEKYKGLDLLINREDAVVLDDNEYFIYDIIDAKVITDLGEDLGILTEVLVTGANDVYVVETKEGKEILLPVIPECVLKVDVNEKLVTVHIMSGLLE